MATATIHFEGWFQCRLATDPDEPRGQSGWTFAVAGEPDLDRIIRFQNAISPRSHGPVVGVFVRQVDLDGQPAPGHSLVGTPVELLDNAVFEGRNGSVANSADEPVIPFRLVIASVNTRVEGFDPVDINSPDHIRRRQPVNLTSNSQTALQASGVINPSNYRATRLARVQADLAAATDTVVREGLTLRRNELQLGSIRRNALGFQLDYAFDLRGPNRLDDPTGSLGLGAGAAGGTWRVDYWMGAWDADALSGYVKGTLSIAT
jgi:hypothetical protein